MLQFNPLPEADDDWEAFVLLDEEQGASHLVLDGAEALIGLAILKQVLPFLEALPVRMNISGISLHLSSEYQDRLLISRTTGFKYEDNTCGGVQRESIGCIELAELVGQTPEEVKANLEEQCVG